MSPTHLVAQAVLAVVLMTAIVYSSEEDQFDVGVITAMDPASEVIRYKFPRYAEWCQQAARNFPLQYWPRERSSEAFAAIKKRGYMGIEIPDFITNQDGTMQGGSATGSKPRYFKNG